MTSSIVLPQHPLTRLSTSEYEIRVATRWPDFDALGHLNHAAYHVCLGAARDNTLRRTVGGFETWPSVLAHVSIDYLREIRLGVPEVIVRTSIVKVGATSVTMDHRLLAPTGEVSASAQSVVVAWDNSARRRREITLPERAALGG